MANLGEKTRPIELCLERIQPSSPERYVRCTAQVGRELGLALGIDGRILWCEQSGVGCEICVSADQRLMAYCPSGTPATVLYRAGRVLELPKQRPVVLRHHDELELAGARFRVHVHGVTDRVHAPAVVRTLVRAAAAASLALVVGGAAGCGESGSVRDAAQPDAGQTDASDAQTIIMVPYDPLPQDSGDASIEVLDFPPIIP
jgi:hypothetical protein